MRVPILALIVAAAGSGLPASTPTEVFTPQRVAELRTVTAAEVAPDGRHVAFVRSVPRQPGVDEDGESWSELWVTGATGEARPFITGRTSVGTVRWTPDGQHVAFLAKRGDDKHRALYLLPLAGGEVRRALAQAMDIVDYSFAADGRRVAFVAREPEAEALKKLRDKGFRQMVYEEDWREQQVWTATLFGEDKPVALKVEGHVRGVRWSPAGDRLLLVVTPTPSVDDSLMRQRLRVIDAGTGAVQARIENPGKLGAYAWSPDGRQVAYVSGEDIHDPKEGRLMVADASTGAARPAVALDWLGEAVQIEWLDAATLAVVAHEGVTTYVGRVPVGSAPVARPTPLWPAGAGQIASLSVGGSPALFAVTLSTAAHPAELFTAAAGGAWQRRTDSNPWLAGLRLARQEVVRHKARDGLELEGILIRPLDEQPGRRYPLILSVHGGPEAHISDGWLTGYSLPGQLAAARGFAVFYPNYRGSTGRGVAFSKLGQSDAAGKEFDDLVDAVDHLIATGLVDRAKVGVTGGSYGGYATAWCSTRFSDRFAAGVMFVGISDKVSKVGTTDIADEEYLVHARKRAWEDWQFLLERSPIFHAGNSRTPLLILHGKDDPRVHYGQSLEMHRHMKLRSQAPVRLVLYPGEEHGNRKAAARYDYNLRLMQWMEHYLIGPGGAPPPYELDYGLPAGK